MSKLVNRAYVTTATTGTGAITLGAPLAGQRSFAAAGIVDGDVVRYIIEDGVNFEIGTGTYTEAGTTLTRAVSESSNANAALNLTGGAVVFVSAAAEDIGNVAMQDFITVGTTTWTKPVWAKRVKVILVSGGGGGGSGRRGPTTQARFGGAGGGGAGITVAEFIASDLPSTVSVTVGGGGAGGGGVTINGTSGLFGAAGSISLFSAPVTIRGLTGGGGGGGSTSAPSGGTGGGKLAIGTTSVNNTNGGCFSGGSGDLGDTANPGGVFFGGIVGGAGGGGASAGSTTTSNPSASSFTGILSGSSGLSSNGLSNVAYGDTIFATGGSGGVYTTATAGQNGFNGGFPGGGGGGGSASDDGFTSGAGGSGGGGMVRVISYS